MAKNEAEKKGVMAKVNAISPLVSFRVLILLFAVFAVVFLGFYNAEYLYKLQNQSLFLKNELFADEILQQTGGLLVYVSRYLLQFCYYPVLGALIMVLGYVLMTKLMIALTKSNTNSAKAACVLPALLLMITQTSLGYAVYDNCEVSFVVSFELGLVISLSLSLLYKKIMRFSDRLGLIVAFACSAFLHLAIGVYSSFPLLILSLVALKKNAKIALIDLALFVMALFVGASLTVEVFGDFLSVSLYSPFINSYYFRPFMWGVLAVLSLLLLVSGALNGVVEKRMPTSNVKLMALAVLSFACVFFASYRNSNFRTELKLQHLTETQDWDGILEAVKDVESPTQGIAAYRVLALDHKDLLTKELFNFPVRFQKIDSEYKDIWYETYYSDYFFYMSQTNLSLMWNMEFWTTTGRNFSILKRFAQIALIQGETETAEKYLNLLKQSTFHSAWAKEHEQYLTQPQKYTENNRSLRKVKLCRPHQNVDLKLTSLGEELQVYDNLDAENFQRRLMIELYECNINHFMRDLSVSKGLYKQLPECMQEVVIFFAMKGRQDLTRIYPVSRSVYERVVTFEKAASDYVDKPEEGAKVLKKYQGSSLYHLLFSNPNVESL